MNRAKQKMLLTGKKPRHKARTEGVDPVYGKCWLQGAFAPWSAFEMLNRLILRTVVVDPTPVELDTLQELVARGLGIPRDIVEGK